jgi:hypothetical protein
MDSLNNEKLIKKAINNNISYVINKKMKSYEERLEYLIEKIEDNIKISNAIFELLESKNIIFEDNKFINKPLKIIKNDNIKNENINDNIKNENINEIIISKNNNKKDYCDEKIENSNNLLINSYKDLKREMFDLDESFVKECLNLCSLQGDLKIFKKMYIDNVSKEFYPIRHIKKKLQYWLDNHMNDDDVNGNYVKNTIIKNIEDCYLVINTFDNYENNIDQFLRNQDHINKLSEEKYKEKLLNKIINVITI